MAIKDNQPSEKDDPKEKTTTGNKTVAPTATQKDSTRKTADKSTPEAGKSGLPSPNAQQGEIEMFVDRTFPGKSPLHHWGPDSPCTNETCTLWVNIYNLSENAGGEIRLNWGEWTLGPEGLSMTEPAPILNHVMITPSRLVFQGGGEVALQFQMSLKTTTPIIGGSIQVPPDCSVLFQSDIDASQVNAGSWYLRIPT